METTRKNRPLPFGPSQARYFTKYIPNKRVGEPNRKLQGPYWYAKVKTEFGEKSVYLGKELPIECKPYLLEQPEARVNSTVTMAYDNLRRALERGNQVIIDIGQICQVCNAEYMPITASRFLLYKED